MTLDLTAPLPEILALVARSADTAIARVGSVWWIGDVSPDDRVHLVSQCKRLMPAEVQAVLGQAGGNATVTEDGLVVLIDRAEVVRRLSSLIESVNSTESETFAVHLWIVSASSEKLAELGVDLVPAAGVSLGVATGDAIGIATASGAAVQLDAVLRAAGRRRGVSVLADPTILIEDGRTAGLSRVERLPIRVSNSTTTTGQVTRQDSIQYSDVGLTVSLTARAIGVDSVRIRGELELSELTGERDGIPVLRTESVQLASAFGLGQPALVAAIERERRASVLDHAWRIGRRSESERSVLQVWAMVVRSDVPVCVPAVTVELPK